ncbi:MAG: hypothetical protein HOV80_17225 [Polyangiaceae bacterium]|nr:hypothetical protein [Polyangiaceae bacterium]
MKTLMVLGCAGFLAVLGMACGDSSGDDDDDDDGAGAGSNTGEFSCCLNGDGYTCPNKAAFDKCSGFDFAECDSACAPSDGACHMMCADQAANATHDPSDCDPDPNAAACNSNTTTTGSGSCTPNAIGCDSSFECCEGLTCKMDPGSGTNGTFCLE